MPILKKTPKKAKSATKSAVGSPMPVQNKYSGGSTYVPSGNLNSTRYPKANINAVKSYKKKNNLLKEESAGVKIKSSAKKK